MEKDKRCQNDGLSEKPMRLQNAHNGRKVIIFGMMQCICVFRSMCIFQRCFQDLEENNNESRI